MSVENVKKFQKDLKENDVLRKKFEEEITKEGMSSEKDYKAIAKIIQKLGYDITEEDFVNIKKEMSSGQELSEEELDKVAGGVTAPEYLAAQLGVDSSIKGEVIAALKQLGSSYTIKEVKYPCPKCGSRHVLNCDPGLTYQMRVICLDCGHFACRDGSDPGINGFQRFGNGVIEEISKFFGII